MTQFRSTMNAPLTAGECERIIKTWSALRSITLPANPDPLEMLDVITDIIMACWETRRAISDGWYYANKRAIPDPPRTPRVQKCANATAAHKLAESIVEAGINDEELTAILTKIGSEIE